MLTRGSLLMAATLSLVTSVMNHTVEGSSKSWVPIGVETRSPLALR